MNVNIPRMPSTGDRLINAAFDTLLRFLQREFGKRTPDDTVRQSVLLRSPDGSTFEVTIDDLGTLTAAKVGPG